MNQYEDTTRYTAPPDDLPDEPTYYGEDIARYVSANLPSPASHEYSKEEVAAILMDCARDIDNPDFGIDA